MTTVNFDPSQENEFYYYCLLYTSFPCPVPGPPGPVGPQGPAGPQGEPGTSAGGLNAYGGLFQAGKQLVFFTAADLYVPVKLNSSMPLKNMTADDSNGLLIAVTGNYEVNYNLLLNTIRGVTAAAAIRRNGETIPSTRGSQTMAIDNTSWLLYTSRCV